MKRFMVFAGNDWYPGGGALDLCGNYSTLEEAEQSLDGLKHSGMSQWAHVLVLDCQEGDPGSIVRRWRRDYQEPWELETG